VDASGLVNNVCDADPACLAQGVSGNYAGIKNNGGTSSIDMNAGDIVLTGGSGGVKNQAYISNDSTGLQEILNAGAITMTGGLSGGNSYVSTDGYRYLLNNASIGSHYGPQSITATSLTMLGTGAGAAASTLAGAHLYGLGQVIDLGSGALTMTASSTATTRGNVWIGSDAGQSIFAGAVTLTGGMMASGYNNTASIEQKGTDSYMQSLMADSLTIQGGSGSGTLGDTGDCGAACAGNAAHNSAGLYNLGSAGQTVDVTGAISLQGGTVGNRNNVYIQNKAAGPQFVIAGSMFLQGGNSGGLDSYQMFGQANVFGGSYLSNGASISSGWSGLTGSQVIASAGAITLNGNSGAGTGGMAGAGIVATGTQTISGGAISLTAGSGSAAYSSWARFVSFGQQIISADTISLTAGTSGIALDISGGGGIGNKAGIGLENASGTATQTITLTGGGTIQLMGGSGTSDNAARIAVDGATASNQNIDFVYGGALIVEGGSGGVDNYAAIEAGHENGMTGLLTGGYQKIYSSGGSAAFYPSITLTGGTGGGVGGGLSNNMQSNDAGIFTGDTGGTTEIYASSITIDGGGAATTDIGGAGIGSSTISITTTGNLTMSGGTGTTAILDAANGRYYPVATPAYIGNQFSGAVDLHIGGDLIMTGGTGSSGGVLIGSLQGSSSMTAQVGGTAQLATTANGGPIGMGGLGYFAASSVGSLVGDIGIAPDASITATGGITANAWASIKMAGSLFSPTNVVSLNAGVGNGGTYFIDAASGTVTANAVSMTARGSIDANTVSSGTISATVNGSGATDAGILVFNTGTPTAVSLVNNDSAAYGSSMIFYNTGDLNLNGNTSRFTSASGGDLVIGSAGLDAQQLQQFQWQPDCSHCISRWLWWDLVVWRYWHCA
jgi:hypothetical protein